MRVLAFTLVGATLIGCSSMPAPPVVDGRSRQAVNSAETASAIASRAAQETRAAPPNRTQSPRSPSYQTMSFEFPFNRIDLHLSAAEAERLQALAKGANRVEVRGRTDGVRPSAADEQIALGRALSAQRYLIERGVNPTSISLNYVSAGDYVADNESATGRARNRRVEIVFFTQ
jgi:outer membrane protein OmpA-like peptidoglycan-associated protein